MEVAQLLEGLPRVHETLSSNPQHPLMEYSGACLLC